MNEEVTENQEQQSTSDLVSKVAMYKAVDGTLFEDEQAAIDHAVVVDAQKTVEAHADWTLRYLKQTSAVNTTRRAKGEQQRYLAFLTAFLTLPVTGDNIPNTVLLDELESKEEQQDLDVDVDEDKKKPAKKPAANKSASKSPTK